jgi:hypothetical protein
MKFITQVRDIKLAIDTCGMIKMQGLSLLHGSRRAPFLIL